MGAIAAVTYYDEFKSLLQKKSRRRETKNACAKQR
jgi:hypothetical protein